MGNESSKKGGGGAEAGAKGEDTKAKGAAAATAVAAAVKFGKGDKQQAGQEAPPPKVQKEGEEGVGQDEDDGGGGKAQSQAQAQLLAEASPAGVMVQQQKAGKEEKSCASGGGDAVVGKADDCADVGKGKEEEVVVVEEEIEVPRSAVVDRLVGLYGVDQEWGVGGELKVALKNLRGEVRSKVEKVAQLIGFRKVEMGEEWMVIGKPEGSHESRVEEAKEAVRKAGKELVGVLVGLDKEVEEQVVVCLKRVVEEFADAGNPKQNVEIKFLISPGQAQEQLHRLAKQKGLGASGWNLLGHGTEIPLATSSKGVEGGEVAADPKLSPRVIPEGELVWRRLQHWCTNVRKEKKFNIWARNLDTTIKQKIIDVALEVGFEAATVQPNGNIHVEIKPPADKQNRKRLRRPSPEVVDELIPVDKAVTENATAHMQEWITEFAKSKKPRDTLNCRFALPADWIRKTATELAESNHLKVVQETGIELIFSRTDLTEEQIEEMLKKAKEEPKPTPQIGRSPRDSRISPRIQNARISPRTANGPSRGRGRGRSDGRVRTPRSRSDFRSRTPPPNFGHHHRHMSSSGVMSPMGSMNSMPLRGVHPSGQMPQPNWLQRSQNFQQSPYAGFLGGGPSYPTANSMPNAPFGVGGGHYPTQPHHVNRGGSQSSRMYREDGFGPY